MERMVDLARRRGATIPFSSNTAYVNTIPLHQEVHCPGNLEYEERLRSWMRWNAMAMVVKANRVDGDLGGHLSSFASLANMLGIGFNHFWKAPSENHGGDLLYPGPLLAGRLRARLPRRPYLRRAADPFPSRSRRQGPVFLPAPETDAGLLAVPDRVDGPRPADGHLPGALPEVPARPLDRRHHRPQGLGLLRRRRDGRTGIAGRHRHGRA